MPRRVAGCQVVPRPISDGATQTVACSSIDGDVRFQFQSEAHVVGRIGSSFLILHVDKVCIRPGHIGFMRRKRRLDTMDVGVLVTGNVFASSMLSLI